MKTFARHIRHLFTNAVISNASMACICFLGLYASNVYARQPAPIIEGSASTVQNPPTPEVRLSFEERLSRIERRLDNDAMVEVMRRLDYLQQEMQKKQSN